MVKALVYNDYGTPEAVLKEQDIQKPAISTADDVLIQVKAVSLNPVDIKRIKGYLKARSTKLPFIPGLDVAGIVAEVGSNVHKLKAGDRVFAKLAFLEGGGAAEFVVAKQDVTVKIH